MTKILYCRDAGFDCNVVVRGESVEDILAQVRQHAASDHQVTVDDAMSDQIEGLIRED